MSERIEVELSKDLAWRLRAEAERRSISPEALAAEAIDQFLREPVGTRDLPPLPSYPMGELLVDITDKDALWELYDRDNPLIQEMRQRREARDEE